MPAVTSIIGCHGIKRNISNQDHSVHWALPMGVWLASVASVASKTHIRISNGQEWPSVSEVSPWPFLPGAQSYEDSQTGGNAF